MTENMKKLLEALSKDAEQGKKAREMKKEELIVLARALGVELTAADFETPEGEMSDKELAAVAGGGYCFCAVGGGGTEGGNDGVCACVAYGQGDVSDNASGDLASYAGCVRCMCIGMGDGQEAEGLLDNDGIPDIII